MFRAKYRKRIFTDELSRIFIFTCNIFVRIIIFTQKTFFCKKAMEFSFPDRAGANGILAEGEVPDPPGAIFEKKVEFHETFTNFMEFQYFHEIPHFHGNPYF